MAMRVAISPRRRRYPWVPTPLGTHTRGYLASAPPADTVHSTIFRRRRHFLVAVAIAATLGYPPANLAPLPIF